MTKAKEIEEKILQARTITGRIVKEKIVRKVRRIGGRIVRIIRKVERAKSVRINGKRDETGERKVKIEGKENVRKIEGGKVFKNKVEKTLEKIQKADSEEKNVDGKKGNVKEEIKDSEKGNQEGENGHIDVGNVEVREIEVKRNLRGIQNNVLDEIKARIDEIEKDEEVDKIKEEKNVDEIGMTENDVGIRRRIGKIGGKTFLSNILVPQSSTYWRTAITINTNFLPWKELLLAYRKCRRIYRRRRVVTRE